MTKKADTNRVFSYLLKLAGSAPVKCLMDPKVTSTVWKENVKLADDANQPGKFTAFCSYEWTSMPDQRDYNPYKFGMAGGSDSHNTGSSYRQNNFTVCTPKRTARSTGGSPVS